VPPLLIRAQPVGSAHWVNVAGGLEIALEVLLQRIHGGEQPGHDGPEDHHRAAHEAEERRRTAQHFADRPLEIPRTPTRRLGALAPSTRPPTATAAALSVTIRGVSSSCRRCGDPATRTAGPRRG